MAEAVFTITADITPQLDERELQRQAQQLAGQLNNILAKQVNKVSVSPESGSFKPFQQEIDKAKGVLDRFKDSLGGVPRTLGNIARSGRSTFLKFTDAINVTRREIVGFGKGIRDSIRDTNLFEDALDGIKSTSASIADLPQNFEDLAAQIRSGTSVIDRMASGGNQLAQLFQPLQQQGEAARTEFVELNRSIDLLTDAVGRLAVSGKDATDSLISKKAAKSEFEKQIISAEKLLDIVKDAPEKFAVLQDSIKAALQAGSAEELFKQLTAIKEESEKITGPLGRIKQFLNEKTGGAIFADVTAEARALDEELREGVIDKIRELGGGALLGPIEKLGSHFRGVVDGVKSAVNAFNAFRTGLAAILPGQSPIGKLVDSVADSVTFFKVLRAEGVPALQAIRGAAIAAFQQFKDVSGITTGVQKVKSELAGLGLIISQTKLGAKLNESLGEAGNFLNKNLVGPLRAAGPQIRAAFSTIGRDVANGFGIGIASGKAPVLERMRELAQSARDTLRRVLKIHSPSETEKQDGLDTAAGFAQGIKQGAGKVSEAMKVLTDSVGQFSRSAALIAGTALAGLGATALVAGKNFNVLKQVINASLPVLVGSKEASAGLLVEINKLNDSSPFARDTFLEMTRVLAGFGVEAKKITPLVDAIQQTVAATGGSDQDLLELSQAFAKIQSQGRLTAESLQSFSVRGVDAVAILAEGFNKTQGEIRKMISDGLIPANKAIDILTKGLKEKFDGATDAVAKNFPGALQRVQARLRDIGGTLLQAFITPEGGGALVTFLNNMADLLSHINKQVLPALAPLLQKVADALVIVSEKTEDWVKQLSGDEFGAFLNKLKPFLPLLAALAGLVPGAFGFIPVIGPIIAGLGGPFTALAAAIGVFLAQSGQLGDVVSTITGAFSGLQSTLGGVFGFLKENFAGVVAGMLGLSSTIGGAIAGITGGIGKLIGIIPGLGKLGSVFGGVGAGAAGVVSKFGNLTPLTKGLVSLFPKLAPALKVLSGPFGLIVSIVAQLILTSQNFRNSLGRLFEAIKPLAAFIASVFAVAIKVMNEAVNAAEPAFSAIVQILAAVFEALKPVYTFLKKLFDKIQESGAIEKVFGAVKKTIEGVIGVINTFIKTLNRLPFIDIKPIEIEANADPAVEAAKKANDAAKKAFEEQKKAAEAASAVILDNFNAATKGVETANAAMSGATDALRQAIDSASSVINGVIDAAQKAQDANEAIGTAREKAQESTKALTDVQKDYARALEDTLNPAQELAKAERDLRDIQKSKTSLDREEIALGKENAKLRQELADLTGQEAAEDRAGLARAEERAQINLNRAKQAELDLLDELNGANKVSLNLSGLSLDQIRAKIAAARLSSSRDRQKSAQEIADAKTSARLDREDAEQALSDAREAKGQFEIDTNDKINDIKDKIRDNDERLNELADDRADILLEEEQSLRNIQRIRAGESAQSQVILDFEDKIKDARKTQEESSKAIETATKGAALAQADLRLKIAEAKGDTDGILKANQDIWNLKKDGLLNAQQTLNGALATQLQNIRDARDAAAEMKNNLLEANKVLARAGNLQSLGGSVTKLEEFGGSLKGGRFVPPALIEAARKNGAEALRAILGSGAAERNGQPAFPTSREIDSAVQSFLSQVTLGTLSSVSVRDIIRDIIHKLGLTAPGFAAASGLSPGDLIHRGMNDGKGLVRMFEFGKEAVLPLTRPTDMKRVVNDPQVLPAILDALNLPGFANGSTTDAAQSAKLAALQDKLLAARKAALAEAKATEDSMEGQEESALAITDEFVRQRDAVQQLNVQLQLSQQLMSDLLNARGAVNNVNNNVVNNALTRPNSNLRVLMQEIFKQLSMQFPGFAEGYAPGDLVQSGLNNGVGIARMFEYGKEAVLPLTRPFDLKRVVRNPSVLPAILNALPRWSRPESTSSDLSDIVGATSDLSTVVRAARLNAGPANASVYERKSQREFAETIGDAVGAAVVSAIHENGGLGGDDVDINIGMGASDTQRMIAREVKRQLDKRTGRW